MKHLCLKSLLAIATLAAASSGYAQIYYADFGNGSIGSGLSTGNIVNFNSAANDARTLIDFATGATSTISVTTAGFGNLNASNGGIYANPSSANTFVKPAGMDEFGSVNGNNTVFGAATLTISGLSASMTYELTFGSNRNNATSRPSIFTITGADAFTNSSDATISTTLLANDTTTVIAGNNNAGLVARFTGINAGADGTFVINMSTTSNSGDLFYINGLNLTAIPEPSTYALLVGALVLVGAMSRRRRRA